MRVWVDLLTPKQLLFFGPIADELGTRGHELLLTSRHYREVDEMASRLGLAELRFVGVRGGKDPYDQLRASIQRIEALLPIVANFKPDASLSAASADCARISFGIRVKHIAVNDSPHSIVAGKLALTLSSHLLAPWIIPYSAWAQFGLRRNDITRYRALDPAAWLKRQPGAPREQARKEIGARKGNKPTVLVRLEESYAPYMIGTDASWSGAVLERLASEFKEDCNLVVLCRYREQLEGVKKRFGDTFIVPEKVVDGVIQIKSADVFVGMGGTMTTESALLGVPTISVFQGSSLYTERYLLSKKLLLKTRDLGTLVKCVQRCLSREYRARCERRARVLLDSMEDPVQVVTAYLLALR